ncbi:MAG: CHASE2 domain-containing protein [Cyanobacteria bacterium P01_F01_bin.86]
MGKWVILELEGDFEVAGFRATLEIRTEGNQQMLQVKGALPPNSALASHLHRHWQTVYRPLGVPQRIKGQKIIHKGSINQRLMDCQQSAQLLRDRFQTWLNADSFQSLDRRLREELSRHEAIQFLIRTANTNLQKLPWHEWDFFERYPLAEVAFAPTQYDWVQAPAMGDRAPHPVRILAILGHSQGINVEADRNLLTQLPQAQVSFLVEPDRQQLTDQLWQSPWDILFFAGHSETHRGQGRIFINATDSLSLAELRYGLQQAIDQGLQLAIFNSCDGLGLAQALEHLSIPQMIVMREPVADRVAAAFLTYFLEAFASGQSLYLAARQARERLQGIEHQFPCASWLPIICQNPLVTPPDWLTLQDRHSPTLLPETSAPLALAPAPTNIPTGKQAIPAIPGWRVLWMSVLVTIAIVMVRLLGLLQPLELTAYDHLMRSRPAETIDSRILVVEVNQADLNEWGGYPLTDSVLAQAITTLEALEPTAIALDMHRHRPRGEGRQALMAQFQQHNNLFTVCAFDQVDQDYGPPPEFSEAQLISQVGFSNFALDMPFLRALRESTTASSKLREDCPVRRHLLSYDPTLATTQSACSTPYSLSFQLAYRFLSQAGVAPLTVTEAGHWQLGTAILQPLTQRFGGYQNLDGLSAQLMLNYRAAQPGQQATLRQVLTGQMTTDQVRDRLVLLGYTAPVARDLVKTPYGEMAGVWVHAHMASQLLSVALDQRPLMKGLPQWHGLPWGDTVWVLGWAMLGGAMSRWLRRRGVKSHCLGWLLSWLLAFVALGWLLFYGSVVALTQGLWLPLVPTLLSVLLTGSCVVLRGTPKARSSSRS